MKRLHEISQVIGGRPTIGFVKGLGAEMDPTWGKRLVLYDAVGMCREMHRL